MIISFNIESAHHWSLYCSTAADQMLMWLHGDGKDDGIRHPALSHICMMHVKGITFHYTLCHFYYASTDIGKTFDANCVAFTTL